MSDITMVFGILLILGLGLPGMLTTWWLLFPRMVERGRRRVAGTPWKTFAMGAFSLALLGAPIAVLMALPVGPAKLLGFTAVLFVLTFATLGAAGLAAELAARMDLHSREGTPAITRFVRASLALELAVAVPVLGWFVLLPFLLVFSLGASVFALMHWSPRAARPASAHADLPSEPQAV